MSLVQIEHVDKAFGINVLFQDISFSIERGQKVALIAKNGTGKTTLLKIIAGHEPADAGQVIIENDVSIAYLPQVPVFNKNVSILEAVLQNSEQHYKAIREYNQALESGEQKQIDNAMAQMDSNQSWDIELRLRQMLGVLDLHDLNKKLDVLSGGESKKLAIASALIDNPDFLILDEPTNHLDLETIEWLENQLKRSTATLLMVTHDRYFLDRVCDHIVEMDQSTIFTYNGNFNYFLQKRKERYEVQQAQADKAKNLLKKELDWANRMPQARGTKAKYRLDAIDDLKAVANQVAKEEELRMSTAETRLGKKVLNVKHVSKSFDDKVILKDFSYQFLKNEIVGIVGENGAGKTTLLNILTEKLSPDSGEVEQGQTLKISSYDQKGLTFDNDMNVVDVAREVAEVVVMADGSHLAVERFLNRFLFPNEMHYQKVSTLSGGEKRRLYLLTVLMKNPNFLILDEPTNDLDIMTLAVLEEYLLAFTGTVVIVSHDRYFLDQLVDHLFVFQGDGVVKDFPGNYSQHREQKALLDRQKSKEEAAQKVKVRKENVKTQLSYKEKMEMSSLEEEMSKLEEEKQLVEEKMNSGELDPDDILSASNRYSEITSLLDEKEMRWLELNELEQELKKNK